MEEHTGNGIGDRFRRIMQKNKENRDEEILSIVNDYKEQGALEEDEVEMISNVIEFSDTVAKDIMTNRTKLDAISDEETLQNALLHMLHGNYTRYPLYHKNLDELDGVLYLKDVMLAYMEHPELALREIAREAFFVPETLPLDTLFDEMQTKKIQLAIVVDEYGQTSGIVSMEDVLEEIVGDIMDEYDVEEEETNKNGDLLEVHGTTTLDELKELLPIEFDEEDEDNFDTLNGLLVSHLGHIPEDGEKADIIYHGYCFHILDCVNRMTDRITIEKHKPKKSVVEDCD